MANEYEIFNFIETEQAFRKRRCMLRKNYNPFIILDEAEFVKRYRLNKDLALKLCDELRPLMKVPKKSTDLSIETKVLIALSFYATGSYQRTIGINEGLHVAQQTVSSVIAQITQCLNKPEIRQKYIKFPNTREERNKIKSVFYNKHGIPGVLGCIDCTHIAIIRPIQHEERYYCRKHYHSLNVQLICDADMQIMSVDASHGGASHDSFIWNNHPLKTHLEILSNSESIWFLGDSGYPLRKSMMTPILEAAPDSPEAYYTNLHVRARNTIERTIGLLKARFRCLLADRVLQYSPQVAGSIVNACVILHNICNRANIPVQQLSNESVLQEVQSDIPMVESRNHTALLQLGFATRRCLVQTLWERRHLET